MEAAEASCTDVWRFDSNDVLIYSKKCHFFKNKITLLAENRTARRDSKQSNMQTS